MWTQLETLRGYQLKAKDGEIGRVRDVLVEEGTWTARWVVADTGTWLLGRKVVLSPVVFSAPDHDENRISVNLTKEEIEAAPPLAAEAPVSQEYEKTYFDHYQWPYYWMGGGLWGSVTHPHSLNPITNEEDLDLEEPTPVEARETVLRSGHELTSYELVSGKERLGYVEDLVFDTEDWSVRYFQFDTRKWFHGKTLQVSPDRVTGASWPEHALYADLSKKELEAAPDAAEDSEASMTAQIRALFGVTTVGRDPNGNPVS